MKRQFHYMEILREMAKMKDDQRCLKKLDEQDTAAAVNEEI